VNGCGPFDIFSRRVSNPNAQEICPPNDKCNFFPFPSHGRRNTNPKQKTHPPTTPPPQVHGRVSDPPSEVPSILARESSPHWNNRCFFSQLSLPSRGQGEMRFPTYFRSFHPCGVSRSFNALLEFSLELFSLDSQPPPSERFLICHLKP